jgi:SAM-dependent methyltransferase
MDDGDSGYQFGSGIGEDEVARLEVQGRALAPATRMILAEAGIRPGMRVLDLGCGAGDVTFVAADLVGPGGSVVGRSAATTLPSRIRWGSPRCFACSSALRRPGACAASTWMASSR